MADRPPRLYSTDAQADVNNEVAQARSAGIDAFVVSGGRGASPGGSTTAACASCWRPRARRHCGSAPIPRPTWPIPTIDPNMPTDPQTMFEWLADRRGSVRQPPCVPARRRPAGHFRLPRLASQLSRTGPRSWPGCGPPAETRCSSATSSARRCSNRLTASTSTPTSSFPGPRCSTSTGPRACAFGPTTCCAQGDRRRIWVASVTPGFDDSHLVDRVPPHVVDRSNGSVYDQQWTVGHRYRR